MTLITRVWNSLVGGSKPSRSNTQQEKPAPKLVSAEPQPQGDIFSYSFIDSPIMAEIREMAQKMEAEAPKKKAIVPDKDFYQTTERQLEEQYSGAIDNQLSASGFAPLTKSQKKSVASTFALAVKKLGPAAAVRAAGDITASAGPEQVAGYRAQQHRLLNLPAVPNSKFENIAVFTGEKVAVAAAGVKDIFVNPHLATIPEMPFKDFLLGHEKHHVDSKDSLRSLGQRHLMSQLESFPSLFSVAANAASELERKEELAADKAGVDSALRNYSPKEAEANIKEMLSVSMDEESVTHPATLERMNRISDHIQSRVKQAAERNKNPLGFTPTFANPVFDELMEMAGKL